MRTIQFLLLVSLFFVVGSIQSICITVWVHGTYPALSVLRSSWSPVRKMIYVEPGLSLAKNLPEHYYYAQLARSLYANDELEYDLEHFYVYGWHSSNVRPGHRISQGRILYEKLNKLIQKYREQHEEIHVRCIGFSHGGNVLLNMLPHLPFLLDGVTLEIVLMGTPIQESTRRYINNPHVTKAYSFYSDGDWIQKIDVQRFHHNCPKGAPFLSQRMFHDDDNVHQICLTVNGKKIGHTKYRRIMHCVPDMLKKVDVLLAQQGNLKILNFDYKVPSVHH